MALQKKKQAGIWMMGLLSLLMAGCGFQRNSAEDTIATVGELAYAQSGLEEPVVYLREASGYQPYLALEDYGDGKTLLLRKYLLPQTERINDYEAYYEDSEMDRYLNGEFLEELPEEMRVLLCDTNIKILDRDCLNQLETRAVSIKRKVFLLSYRELGYPQNGHVGEEGAALKYFEDNSRRSAYAEAAELPGGWWLRSADSTYASCVYAVGPEGEIGSTNAFEQNGVRPAFCVDEDLEIYREKGKYFLKGEGGSH